MSEDTIDTVAVRERLDDLLDDNDEDEFEQMFKEATDIPVELLAHRLQMGEEIPDLAVSVALVLMDAVGPWLPETLDKRELASRLLGLTERLGYPPSTTLYDIESGF